MPNHPVHLKDKFLSQENGPRGCCLQPRQLLEPKLVPPERGHLEDLVFVFPDSPDYLRDQSDQGKSVEEAVVGQCILVLQKICWAVRVVILGEEVDLCPAKDPLRGCCSEIACQLRRSEGLDILPTFQGS